MTEKANTTNLSRRWFLKGAAAVLPAATVASPCAAVAATGPLSPAEYLAEMRRIGWRPVSSVFQGQPQHVIEYGPDDAVLEYDSYDGFRIIQKRVSQSGDDFWERTSRYLYEQNLREDVGPRVRGPHARISGGAQ